jgi:hypothetical protein
MAKIETGESVIIILHSPREKLVGILQEINASGVFLRGVDLNYFDEWTQAIKAGETYLPMQDQFFPMWRVERISKDEGSAELPSHAEIFKKKTGYDFGEF